MGMRLCKEWENNFPMQQSIVNPGSHAWNHAKLITHFSMQLQSTVLPFATLFDSPVFRVFHFITHMQTDSLI